MFTTKKQLLILTYHGLVDEITHPHLQRNFHTVKEFKKHIEILKKKKYTFINANELIDYVEDPIKINKKLVCITFDDGYQNNLMAIEILNRFNIPAIFFISTQSIGSNISIWTVNLSLLILEGSLNEIFFNNQTYLLTNDNERHSVFAEIRKTIKSYNSEQRKKECNSIYEQFPDNELEQLFLKHNYFKMLTWDEIREVQSKNIQFQSHGVLHEIFHENQLLFTIETEIKDSKEKIEKELNNDVYLYAYPNGNYNKRIDDILENLDYKVGLSLGDSNFIDINRFNVNRLTPNRKEQKFMKQIR